MAFNSMAVLKVEFKPPLDKCTCCLQNGQLEDLWTEHLSLDGEIEVFGMMLQECFQFSWPAAEKYMEQICNKCVGLLRLSLEFRRNILAAKEKLEQLIQHNEVAPICTDPDDEVSHVAIKEEIDESEHCHQEMLKQSPESQKEHNPEVVDSQKTEFVSCDSHGQYGHYDNSMEIDNLEDSKNGSEQMKEKNNCSSDEELDFEHENDEEEMIQFENEFMLPSRSKEKYEKAYEDFVKWRTGKKTNSVSEHVLLAYFHELSKTRSPSTLWCDYSKLKNTIRLKHGVNIGDYAILLKFLKQRSNGYIPKKSKVLSEHDIETYLKEAPDVKYLLEKMPQQKKTGVASKRDCRGEYKDNDEQIEAWLEELEEENEFSDCDDEITENMNENQEQHEENVANQEELSESESDASESDEKATQNRDQSDRNYIGNNGFVWSKTEIPRSSRTPAHNTIHVSRSTDTLLFQSFVGLWSKIFDPEMVATIVSYTNEKLQAYREQFRNTNRQELKDTNETEILSLFGVLYYSSVFKCNGADANYIFSTDGTGHEIFRCVMSKCRFCTLINCLRFDKGADRQERLKSDRLAAISALFDKFVTNSQQSYIPGPNMCVDEMLIPFRGRCKFIVYMQKKPAKYGIKVVVLSDAETYYTYNAYIYRGKDSDGTGLSAAEKQLAVPTQSVLRLSKPIVNSNRNITADNWFSSIPLMQVLSTNKLTYLGTLKKNNREIPPEFLPKKDREPGSSLYGFTKDYTLLSYVPNKNKAVLLISSSHHNSSTDETTKEPTMIADYNHTKGEVDKKCSIYSCTRKTRRWPMAMFYRILDLAGVNSFILYETCPGAKLRRGDFLLSLARDLVLPSLKERVYNDRLPRELRLAITRVLGRDLPPAPPVAQGPGPSGRKLCSICPSKLKRQTRYHCCACKKPICLQCSAPLCQDCNV